MAVPSPTLPDEAVADYEKDLQGLSKSDLLAFPYLMKAEGNRLISAENFKAAVPFYLKSLLSFHYMLNHSIMNVAEEIAEYVDKIEVRA